MRLLYVTKQLPYGETEAFILPEVASHRAAGWQVWLAPTQLGALVHEEAAALEPATLRAPLLSPAVLAGFAAEALRNPLKVLNWGLVAAGSGRLALRNLAVWPKGVWLGRQARRLGIDHIHVHWASVPATMGMIAADVAGLGFSVTAHRYDIAQGNLLPEKARRARFIRAIDQAGAREIQAQIGADWRGLVRRWRQRGRRLLATTSAERLCAERPRRYSRALGGHRLLRAKGGPSDHFVAARHPSSVHALTGGCHPHRVSDLCLGRALDSVHAGVRIP